jgi:flagellar hook-basal body complex protein FliE
MGLTSVSMDSLLAKLDAARTAASALPGSAGAVRGAKLPREVDFGAMLKSNIDKVDQAVKGADTLAARFQMGDASVSLEDSMVALQKANVTFQAAVQVRNKVIAAYQDIMNLPI